MKFFRKILKNKLFYLVLLLGVFLTPIFKFTLQAQEVYDDGFNLASPDLENKEYLGDGVYRLYNVDVITLDYNVYNGVYAINGTINPRDNIKILIGYVNGWVQGNTYTSTINIISENAHIGNVTFESLSINTGSIYSPSWTGQFSTILNGGSISSTHSDQDNNTFNLRLYKLSTEENSIFNNLHFTLQIEKGTEATPYKLPIQPLYDHAYNNGFDDGYESGFDDGESLGYDDGYNQAKEDYGYYDNETGKWVKVDERKQVFYDRGYQDGVDDTIASYNDNGLFIPQSTPKGHLTVEEDLRYGDPYFYLQDFRGQYDVEYFGLEHNRWLEKAFDWAYSVESDFLAINDVYIIKYNDDIDLYKYFFYKYNTDSIYFYNDNGTLLKVIERVNFDYFIHEVPELSVEEQDRIDQAYASGYNKAKSEYGYYDTQSDEYLTAVDYGEIQYNKGVISIRDRAYLDGFYTGMMDSHKYGFDWMRATYSDLIEERPTLGNLRDETSFTHQLAYSQGFNVAREQYGYWNGRVWVTAGSIRDLTYTEAYDLGFRDATNELYDDIHDEIYEIGYRDGQRLGMNNKFYTGLEKWLVPAIIVVLFFGFLMLFPRNKED